ncbi:hypothetical protein AAFC00_000885 [Neodothiora populina]|uniref:General negative regulator of transcription subunit n=1 Tax=Neodothiora populina TaxID=2781224 RepID=A0ABR3PM44_9PEZI
MAARKLQQEMDKTFKKVDEGIVQFEGIYEKLMLSTNQSQRDKQEETLKREIKKLQRSRDTIKAWAAQNDIKDKKPLLDKRKAIETCMEKFKAVEKEMKTKAFSKEGLSAAAKLDPREQEKQNMCNFLSDTVEELERQIETFEAEAENLQATMKKKKDTAKAERIAELGERVETHKWHQTKLELILRLLENDSLDMDPVKDIEDSIKYYVENNQEVDFAEDDTFYDDLSLDAEEENFGMTGDADRMSSQDAHSIQDDTTETNDNPRTSSLPSNKKNEPAAAAARRPSVQLKSPLPALATLNTSTPTTSNGPSHTAMKPAPLPTIPTGQPLKYASAAAAAAASDKNGLGIAPLPPPPGVAPNRQSSTASPVTTPSLPATVHPSPSPQPAKPSEALTRSPAPTPAPASASASAPAATAATSAPATAPAPAPPTESPVSQDPVARPPPTDKSAPSNNTPSQQPTDSGVALTNGDAAKTADHDDDESIYHLPSSLDDLLESFNATKSRVDSHQPIDERMLAASRICCPSPADAEKPFHYKPQSPYNYTPSHYPQEPLPIFNDERLYSRIDTDTLFYAFYYRQGTYQQYCAAKALKSQSWRFHKQYQTWFQRHEEPKNITEEYEQGTYRFFDYESTWMNRRKADFKFAYKFLEDDL